MAGLQKQQQPVSRRRCIFCGGSPMSREHLWPKWASPLLRGYPHTDHHDIRAGRFAPYAARLRQGAVTTTKFKVVCRACNNGWMSGLEEAVRPFLEPMIQGAPVILAADAQRTLAEWLVLKTMVADCEVLLDSVLSGSDREQFKLNRAFPSNLEIWLFKCGDGPWQSCFRRQSATLSFRPIGPSIRRQPNVNGTAFGLGHALFYVTVSKSADFEINSKFGSTFATRLFPFESDALSWPPPRSISDAEATDISQTFARIQKSVGGRWHGEVLPAPTSRQVSRRPV